VNASAPVDLTAIVVTWNSAAHVAACLDSIERAGAESRLRMETIVVDNASADGTAALVRARFPRACVVESPRNVGFGAGANLGLARARGLQILLLNPDAALEPGALVALRQRLADDPRLACVGPRYLRPDGGCERAGRRFPSVGAAIVDGTILERWLRRAAVMRSYYMDGAAAGAPADWLHGACLLFRQAALQQVSGFDPGYFMYAEELDLQWRLRRRGWRCAEAPAAMVRHHGGASADQDPEARARNFFRSRYRFAAACWGRPFAVGLRIYVATTDLARLAEEAVKLAVRPNRQARRRNARQIARLAAWQWLGWRR